MHGAIVHIDFSAGDVCKPILRATALCKRIHYRSGGEEYQQCIERSRSDEGGLSSTNNSPAS